MDRALGFEPRGWGFDPLRGYRRKTQQNGQNERAGLIQRPARSGVTRNPTAIRTARSRPGGWPSRLSHSCMTWTSERGRGEHGTPSLARSLGGPFAGPSGCFELRASPRRPPLSAARRRHAGRLEPDLAGHRYPPPVVPDHECGDDDPTEGREKDIGRLASAGAVEIEVRVVG